MITVDQIMATRPCDAWPRARVEAAIAALGGSSWTAAAEAARAGRWSVVSFGDLRLTAYRAATPAQRLAGVRRSIRVRIDAQIRRWPEVECIAGVRAELRRWCDGAAVDLPALRAEARAAAAAIADAARSDAAAYDDDAYADAYADAAAAADAAYYDACFADAAAAAAAFADARAYDAYAAYAYADAAFSDARAYDADADADADSPFDVAEAWAGLVHICGLLDGTVTP